MLHGTGIIVRRCVFSAGGYDFIWKCHKKHLPLCAERRNGPFPPDTVCRFNATKNTIHRIYPISPFMIYRINFSSEEADGFRRVFDADSEATFLELHQAILASVNYPDDQMTSFFLCNDRWEKEQEVTLVEMDSNFEYDNMVMEETRLSDLIEEQGQRLIYVFDPMFERHFFGRVKEILPGTMDGVNCVESKGKAPKQLKTEDPLAAVSKDGKNDLGLDEDFYGDSQYDEGDIDMEGFQDLSFEDGSMF